MCSAKEEKKLVKALKDSGYEWEIRPGRKHRKIFLNGQMIGVICNSPRQHGKDHKNIIRAIEKYRPSA